MAKGLFSWFGRGSKDKAAPEETAKTTPVAEQPTSVPVVIAPSIEPEITPQIAEVEITVTEPVVAETMAEMPETTEAEVVLEPEVSVDESVSDFMVADSAGDVAEFHEETQERPKRAGLFSRLVKGLMRTRESIGAGFMALFRGKKLDDDLFDELETQLLIADLGVETTQRIMQSLTKQAKLNQLKDAEALYELLKQEMAAILQPVSQPLQIDSSKTPYVILMIGVNGVGKTTTIGKLAKHFQAQGKSVMLAAGDTFRAAAVEQLQVWGQRNQIPVIAQHTGADSASVIFDAIQAAKARNVDILIADTAGRLQNKGHLMEELKKIVRVMKKLDDSAPHEVMLTLDASTGQNAISQAKLFGEAVGVNGITLTKLDGTAKGGVIFAIANQFGIPIRYIGVGEAIEDLRPFEANDFIEALFGGEQH
jgi:fused signal recognition particle receptor